MAEVTNLPFRLLCKEYGAGMLWTEQINVLSLISQNKKVLRMIETSKDDKPLALQLSGNNPKHLIEAAKVAKKHSKFDFIDINMGCPSKKIVNNGYGSALLKEKEKLRELVEPLVKSVKVPVTVKMRSGFKSNEAVEIAKILESSGIAALTIHARTQEQKYTGNADWNTIKKIKQALKIPVIGNGDVDSPEKAKKMLETTGCDYVMIGRAAIKNPMIFKQCLDFEKSGKYKKTTNKDRIKMLERYLELCKEHKYLGLKDGNIKMLATNFIKGENDSAKVKDAISRAKTEKEILEIYKSFLNKEGTSNTNKNGQKQKNEK